MLRSMAPAEALEMLEQRLTERERNEVQLERDTARRARARDAALSPGTDAAVARCVDEETLGRKAIANLMENSDAHCVDALRDDVLPGDPGDPDHSWQGLIRTNVTTIVDALRR